MCRSVRRSHLLPSLALVFAATIQAVVAGDLCMHGLKTLGYTLPRGVIKVEYGNPVIIDCILDADSLAKGSNASDIRFFRNGEQLPRDVVTVVNSTTARLVDKTAPAGAGKYYCKLKTVKSAMKMVCLNTVIVGYRPKPVEKFTCVSRDWEDLNCSWSLPANPAKTSYKLYYTLPGRAGYGKVHACVNDTEERGYCYWSLQTIPPFRRLNEYLIFRIVGSNVFGNVTFPDIRFHSWAHVLPAKPLQLEATDITSNTTLLRWNLTESIKPFPSGLDHRVQYKSVCDPSDEWTTSDTTELHPKATNFTLQGLKHPNAVYDVRLYLKSAKAVGERWWSEPASVTFKTKSTVPSFPPKLDGGSFHVISRLNKRDIIVYWQRIPRCAENGDDFTYRVLSVEENGTKVEVKPTKVTKSYAFFERMSTNSYRFEIVSANQEGISSESSVVFVPSKKEQPPPPTGFTKYVNEKGIIQLSWNHPAKKEGVDPVDSYTVFWCQNDRDGPDHCAGLLNWTRVSRDTRSFNVTVREGKVYEFAISSNTRIASSGMIWASCTLRPNSGLEKVKDLRLVDFSATHIEVEFNMDCLNQLQNISQYNIYYCPIVSPQNATCRVPEKVVEVYGFKTSVRANITDLQPYTTYLVYVARVANNGAVVSDASEPLYTTTLEAAPSPPHDLMAVNISNDTATLQWRQPVTMNGKLNLYRVFVNGQVFEVRPEQGTVLKLDGLNSFSVYTIKVKACTGAEKCSNSSEVLILRTKPGLPGKVARPVAHVQNFTKLVVKWSPPDHRGAMVNHYQLQITPSTDSNGTHVVNVSADVGDNTSAIIKIPECRAPDQYYNVAVRAVNVDTQGRIFEGEWSDPTETYCTSVDPSQRLKIVVWCVVSVSVLCFCFVTCYGMRRLVAWWNVAHKIEVKLPPGLAPLSEKEKDDYHIRVPWQIYNIRENDIPKSVDEPPLLSGKRDQRSPSGDSSGCSTDRDCPSSSSTTGTQVSSDSGAEAGHRIVYTGKWQQPRPLSCLFSEDSGGGKASATPYWSTPDLSVADGYAGMSAPEGSLHHIGGEPYCRAGYVPSPAPAGSQQQSSRGYVSVDSVIKVPSNYHPNGLAQWLEAPEDSNSNGYVSLPAVVKVQSSAPQQPPSATPVTSSGYVTLASLDVQRSAAEDQAVDEIAPPPSPLLLDDEELRSRLGIVESENVTSECSAPSSPPSPHYVLTALARREGELASVPPNVIASKGLEPFAEAKVGETQSTLRPAPC